jgi:hypothetical protein
MKKCTKCLENKGLDCFRIRESLKCGYQSWCKSCESVANKLRALKNRKPSRRKPPIIRTKEELAYLAKIRMLKHRYGLSYEEYLNMYREQEGLCKICFASKELGGTKGLVVDHCHTTGKVRGLLCHACNSAIGKLKENEDIINNALKYLKGLL